MAAGRTHDIINLSFLPVAVYYLQPENFSGFISGYIIGTFFLSPDNDIYHSKPNRRWKVLRFIWYPYTRVFSHRGVSHLPVLGSIFKLFYLIFVIFTVFLFMLFLIYLIQPDLLKKFSFEINLDSLILILKHPFTVSFLIGLLLSEIVHIATDVIYSTAKRLKLIR
ncbi:MAG TPA: hypothetical protein ENK22_00895 [Persephonella sp.]|nr:hypothetical protein [Persephonella sp.]